MSDPTEALVKLEHEPCPHCRVAISQEMSAEHAQRGFDCLYCGHGIRVVDDPVMRMMALTSNFMGVTLYSALSLTSTSLLLLLLKMGWSDIFDEMVPASGLNVWVLVVMIVTLGPLSLLLWNLNIKGIVHISRLWRGSKLAAATRVVGSDRYTYSFDARTSRKRMLEVERNEELEGGLTLSAGGDASQRGAVSVARGEGGEVSVHEEAQGDHLPG